MADSVAGRSNLSLFLSDDQRIEADNFDIEALVARLGLDDSIAHDDSDAATSPERSSTLKRSQMRDDFIDGLISRRVEDTLAAIGSDGDYFESAEEGDSEVDAIIQQEDQRIGGSSLRRDHRSMQQTVDSVTQGHTYFPSSTPPHYRTAAISGNFSSRPPVDLPPSSMSAEEFLQQWPPVLPTKADADTSLVASSSSPSSSLLYQQHRRTSSSTVAERRNHIPPTSITPRRAVSASVPTSSSSSSLVEAPLTPTKRGDYSVHRRSALSSPSLQVSSSSSIRSLDAALPPSPDALAPSATSPPSHRLANTSALAYHNLSQSTGSLSHPTTPVRPNSNIDWRTKSNPTSPTRAVLSTPPSSRHISVQIPASPSPSPSPSRRLSFISQQISTSPSSRSRRFSALFGIGTSAKKDTVPRSIQVMTPHYQSRGDGESLLFQQSTWRSTWSPMQFEEMERELDLDRMEINRQEVLYELGTTEKAFVDGQRDVLRVFALPLRKSSRTFIAGVPFAFGFLLDWLEEIIILHSEISEMMVELRRCSPNGVILQFAASFQPYVIRLEAHQPYLVRFEAVTRAIDVMTDDMTNSFGEFLRRQSKLPELCGLSLSSFLLKPLQRLMKLPLFFKQLCDLTPPSHVDHAATLQLYKSTDSIIRLMQDVKTREDEYSALKGLVGRVHGLPAGFQLARRNRRLLAFGALHRVLIREKHAVILAEDSNSSSSLPASSSSTSIVHSTSANSIFSANPRASQTQPNRIDRPDSFGSDSSRSSAGSTNYTSSSDSTALSPASSSHSNDKFAAKFASAFPQPSMSKSPSSPTLTRLVKTKAKESIVHIFVFSDLVVFTKKDVDGSSAGLGHRRMMSGGMGFVDDNPSSTFRVEPNGIVSIKQVADKTGITEHDHLIALSVVPFERLPSPTVLSSSSLISSTPTVVYLTLPPPISSSASRRSLTSSTSSSTITSVTPALASTQERIRWLQAFERPYLAQLPPVPSHSQPQPRSKTQLKSPSVGSTTLPHNNSPSSLRSAIPSPAPSSSGTFSSSSRTSNKKRQSSPILTYTVAETISVVGDGSVESERRGGEHWRRENDWWRMRLNDVKREAEKDRTDQEETTRVKKMMRHQRKEKIG